MADNHQFPRCLAPTPSEMSDDKNLIQTFMKQTLNF